MADRESGHDLAAYKAHLLDNPQLVLAVTEQLQLELAAMQTAAAVRQAALLAKQQGKDTAEIAERLQAMQLGTSLGSVYQDGSNPSTAAAAADITVPPRTSSCGGNANTAGSNNSSSSSNASTGGKLAPVTPGDITVAANALLVACKAAGALCGVPQLLERSLGQGASSEPSDSDDLISIYDSKELTGDLQELAEWVVLLHPLLTQLLPAEQGQLLAGLRGHLRKPRSSSNSSEHSGVQQQEATGSNTGLSAEDVQTVLGALQHVVIPGQRGCCNPRCYCLDGVSEWGMKTQVCVACRGARYCSAACQRAHWSAGHKAVCKAAQAAAKAAGEGAATTGPAGP
jgi:hypothetical protein